MSNMTWRTLTIDTDGSLSSSPSKMHAATGDGIAWFVINNMTSDTVKVKVKDFQKKANGSPLAAVTFSKDRCTVDANGIPGMIVGQVTFEPNGPKGTTVLAKYTLEVKSAQLNKDYDPDLEIEQPD
jgi:hypothetical protein